jgi:hypothetical protein
VKPLYVSFYTPTYAEEAAGLRDSLDKFGLQHHIQAIPSFGDWTQNTHYKAAFLLSVLKLYSGLPVVWLDADARVRRYPLLFDVLDCDFAGHWRRGELLSGTMYLANNRITVRLLTEWQKAMESQPKEWDQRSLQTILNKSTMYQTKELPPAYSRIFDAPEMCDPRDTVIEHLQASRKLRATV